MNPLNRKLVRDLGQMKGQSVAICMVIGCGVATFVMSMSTMASLQTSQLICYDRYRFAHIFAHLKRAPLWLTQRIRAIPGVQTVQTRVVSDVNLDVTGMVEPAVGRLVSFPENPSGMLNSLHLLAGRHVAAGRQGEVVASQAFAQAHGLRPGGTVTAVINGRRQTLEIVGVGISPEYLYQVQPGEIIPDDKRFGVFWMGQTEMAAAFDMQGAFNDVCLTLTPGTEEPEVLRRLDQILDPYGGLVAHGRQDQLTHQFISSELKQLRAMALVPPAIFLSVAAFLLNVVLARLITTQREQIAALKAFGYRKRDIAWHYLKLALIIAGAGAFLGTAIGVILARDLVTLYGRYFRFPLIAFRLGAGAVPLALLASGAAAALGVVTAVHRAAVLPPAQAMRPEPPSSYRPTILERFGLGTRLPHTWRMILRNLERQPVKSLLSMVGIALAVAILILGSFAEDALEHLIAFQFQYSHRHDMSLAFVEPVSPDALAEIQHLPGVLHSEPLRIVPARLRRDHRWRRAAITGLTQDADLHRLLDENLHRVALPRDGVLLSDRLAQRLGVDVGQMLLVEVLEGSRPVRNVPVRGLVTGYVGLDAYMDIDALNRLTGEGGRISGATVAVDPNQEAQLYTTLKATPKVSGVTIKNAALANFRQTLADNLLRMRAFNIVFASMIACGVVYNSARISLSEQSRDLASLRVLGFTRGEISAILLGGLAVLALGAIPLGLVMGYGLVAVATLALDTDVYSIPLVVTARTYAFAATVIILASIGSGLTVRRRLDRLDLVAVLKSKE